MTDVKITESTSGVDIPKREASVDLVDMLSRLTRAENEKCDLREIERHYWSVKQTIWALGGFLLLIAGLTEIRIEAKLKDTYKDLYSEATTNIQKQLDLMSQSANKKAPHINNKGHE